MAVLRQTLIASLEGQLVGTPDSGYRVITEFAADSVESVFDDTISYPANKNLLAGRTIRVFTFVAGHVADIGIMKPGFQGNISGHLQGVYRGAGQIFYLIHRMKSRKMDRNVRTQVRLNPVSHPA